MNPNVYKRERVPDPTGVGRPYMVQTSGHVDPNSRCCWVLVSKRSQVAAEHGLDVEESLFLLLDVVEYVLVVGVGTGMFFGSLFEQVPYSISEAFQVLPHVSRFWTQVA